MLGFGGRSDDVNGLIAKRKYAQAIDILSEDARGGGTHVRLQLADVLVLADRAPEAVPVLMRLADDYAAQGLAGKAIAVLKKVQKLDPSRRDVEERLANVLKQPRTPSRAAEAAGSVFGAEPDRAIREKTEQRIEAARGAGWTPDYGADETEPPVPAIAAGVPEPPPIEVSAIEVEPEPIAEPEAVESPLFGTLHEDELVAFIKGLRLLTFDPGDIVITQGDRGDSLFVVTSGTLKAFIHDPAAARQLMVRTMADGEFFGEISILSGRPRTATITAATPCELLELDRPALDEICTQHPRVREVLEEFYVQRASTQAEALERAQQIADGRV